MFCDRCEQDKDGKGSICTSKGELICLDCLRGDSKQYQEKSLANRNKHILQPTQKPAPAELPRYMLKCDKCHCEKHRMVFDFSRIGTICRKCSAKMSRRATALVEQDFSLDDEITIAAGQPEPSLDDQLKTAAYVMKKFREL